MAYRSTVLICYLFYVAWPETAFSVDDDRIFLDGDLLLQRQAGGLQLVLILLTVCQLKHSCPSNVTEVGTKAGIFKQSMGARNRVGIGLSYWPARLHRRAELIPWNRFLGSGKKYGLKEKGRAAICKSTGSYISLVLLGRGWRWAQ